MMDKRTEYINVIQKYNLYNVEEILQKGLQYNIKKYGEYWIKLPSFISDNPLLNDISNDEFFDVMNILRIDFKEKNLYYLIYLYYLLPLPPFWNISYNEEGNIFDYKKLYKIKYSPNILYLDNHIKKYRMDPNFFENKNELEEDLKNKNDKENKNNFNIKIQRKKSEFDMNTILPKNINLEYDKFNQLMQNKQLSNYNNKFRVNNYFINKKEEYEKNKLFVKKYNKEYTEFKKDFNPNFMFYLKSNNPEELRMFKFYLDKRNAEIREKREQQEIEHHVRLWSTNKAKYNEDINYKLENKFNKIYDYKTKEYPTIINYNNSIENSQNQKKRPLTGITKVTSNLHSVNRPISNYKSRITQNKKQVVENKNIADENLEYDSIINEDIEEEEIIEDNILNYNEINLDDKKRPYSIHRTFLSKNYKEKNHDFDLNKQEKLNRIQELRQKTGIIGTELKQEIPINNLFKAPINNKIQNKKNINKLNNDNINNIDINIKKPRIQSSINTNFKIKNNLRPISAYTNPFNIESNRIQSIREISKIKDNLTKNNKKIDQGSLIKALMIDKEEHYREDILLPQTGFNWLSDINEVKALKKRKKKKKKKRKIIK